MAGNNYFQFKQFRITQENAAMKVGTDGVMLGSWANVNNSKTALDIGTGTGLIALMVAQRSKANIDAIEIDESAIVDAQSNFKNSPWNDRLKLINTSLQKFAENSTTKYDCIVCNPPYFANGVQADKKSRAIARHTDTLNFEELIEGVVKLLDKEGKFGVVLPSEVEREFRNIATKNRLFAFRIARIKPKPSKPLKRVLIEFRLEAYLTEEIELTFETENHHEYTKEFIELFKDFYLKL